MFGRAGTQGYMAPEILERKGYDASCDIFSTGVILFNLLTARKPFNEANKTDEKYKLLIDHSNEKFWEIHNDSDKYSNDTIISDTTAQNLIENMLEYDNKERITIENIEKHEWFTMGNILDAATLAATMSARYKTAMSEKQKKTNTSQRKKVENVNYNTMDEFESALSEYGIEKHARNMSTKGSYKSKIDLEEFDVDEQKDVNLKQMSMQSSKISNKMSNKLSNKTSQMSGMPSSGIELSLHI